ncbi:MAG: tRNA lysidine(34) synthetase TilS, partial [Solimonas sp.]
MEPFAPFEAAPVVAVAVSGGRDSLCLALLTQAWAAEHGGRSVGLIVDHGLRPEAAGEAKATCEVLAQHGIEAAILTWSGAKPWAGVQEAARAARYQLLGEECRRRGIVHLLLGHHADDQVETVAMRAARDSGRDGLAGMAALVEQPQLRLLRPLLGVPRARLTATLLARGVAWIDDPSNSDLRFERARLRALPPQQIGELGEARLEMGERSAREGALARAAVDTLEFDEEGMAAIDQSRFAYLDDDMQARLLSRVVQSLGGRDHPPRRDRLWRAIRR